MKRVLVMSSAVCLLLLLPFAGPAQSEKAAKPAEWIDLDGDGLNDNAVDHDMNGIPDFGDAKKTEPPPPTASGIFADLKPTEGAISAPSEPCSLIFSRLTKLTLAQCLTRCDLEQSFGGGAGVSNNAAAGGACAGGVCLR